MSEIEVPKGHGLELGDTILCLEVLIELKVVSNLANVNSAVEGVTRAMNQIVSVQDMGEAGMINASSSGHDSFKVNSRADEWCLKKSGRNKRKRNEEPYLK